MYARTGTARYLLIFVLIFVQFGENECWRSRPSPSRPRPSPSRPFPRPSPTHRPFPVHAPTYRPFPTHAPTYRPVPTHAPTYRPFPTHAPTYRPFPTHAPTYKPFPTHSPTHRPFPTHAPTYKPFPTHSPTQRPFPTHSPTYKPFPTHAPTYRPQPAHYPTARTQRYPTQPTRYPTQPSRYPVGPHPTYPGYNSGGVFSAGRPYQPTYQVPVRVPTLGGASKIKVYNVHNYHPANYWAPPSYPVYHYSYRDTGSNALGFYLGYSLGRISHPTYYHHHNTFYDGYSPRYDHYTVHHYYHNSANIPKQQTVTTQVIIQCGDGSQICPANTTSLCTSNGQIMCVVVAGNTVSCRNNPGLRCVQSTIPCENDEAPECKGIKKGEKTVIDIPCISNTTIEGNVKTVNNSIVSTDLVKNVTAGMTTMPTVETTLPTATFPSAGARTKRDVLPQYCVTIVAQPSQRVQTEGEQVFNEVTNVFEKFFKKAFGMDQINTNLIAPK